MGNEQGFQTRVLVSEGLTPDQFLEVVSKKLHMVDTGALHGPDIHRLQSHILGRAFEDNKFGDSLTNLADFYKGIADSLLKIDNPENPLFSLTGWDILFKSTDHQSYHVAGLSSTPSQWELKNNKRILPHGLLLSISLRSFLRVHLQKN